MATRKLSDREAFLLMLRLLFRIFSKHDEKRLVEFLFKFCELHKKPVDSERLLNDVRKLVKEQARYLAEKKFLQVQVNCSRDAEEEPDAYEIALGVGTLDCSLRIKTNQTETAYVPVQVGRIANESIRVEICQAPNRLLKRKATTKTVLHELRIDLGNVHLIKGHNLQLKYDQEQKQYEQLKGAKRSTSKARISSKLKLLSQKFFSNAKMTNRSSDAKVSMPNFEFEFSWSPFDCSEFENSDSSIKEQLIRRHQVHTDQHLRLLKYIHMQKAKENTKLDESPLGDRPLNGSFLDDNSLGEELKAILDQSLFEGALNYADHQFCLRRIADNLQGDQSKASSDLKRVSANRSTESSVTLSRGPDENDDFLSFIIKPFENLNVPLPLDLPFRPKTPTQPASLRRRLELPFDFELMKHHFIEDFDATSHKVVIWVTQSFSTPRFYRFSAEKSLNLFNYDHPIRKLCICIYTSVPYRLLITLCIIFEFICFSSLPFERQIYFIPLHMFDTLITVIAKGFVFTQYSYLVSGFWYYGDGLLTVVYLLVEAINVQFSDRIAEPYSNYLYGIAMLTVLFRVLRLVREIKNSITLSYFRILLYILGKLVLQLFPLLVLSFFVILISAVLAMNTMDDIFNYICFPDEFDYRKFDRIVRQKLSETLDDYSFFEHGSMRTNINQTYFLYSYRPCMAKSWYPLAYNCKARETCTRTSDSVIRYLSRNSPDFATFDNFYSTFFLILTMIFNSNSDVYFYRIVQHTGLFGYLFCSLLYLFGFYIVSLVLALIADSYGYQMTLRTRDFRDKVKFFQGEPEFSFQPESDFSVCLRSSKEYIRCQESKCVIIRKDTVGKKPKNSAAQKEVIALLESAKGGELVDFNSLYAFIDEMRKPRMHFAANLFNQFDRFKEQCTSLMSSGRVQMAIEYVVWAKFFIQLCIFQIEQPLNYTMIMHEKLRIYYYLFWIDNLLTLLMTVEMLLKIFVFYGARRFFAKTIHIFDSFIVLINLIALASRLFDLGDDRNLARLLSPFTYLRILSLLYVKWRLLQIIYAAILSGKNQLQANIVFYAAIYIILSVVGYRFMATFSSDIDEDDLLAPNFNFATFSDSLITVFYVLMKFEFSSIAFNYLTFNKKNDQGETMFASDSPTGFVEYLPFIVEIFLLTTIFVHLFFRELFVPQLIYYLDISKLLQVKEPQESTRFSEQESSMFLQQQKLRKIFTEFRFRNLMKKRRIFSLYFLAKWLNQIAFYFELVNVVYFLVRDLWLPSHGDLVILVIGLVLQVMFLAQLVLKQFESLSRRDLFKEKELIHWRFLALLFEVVTLIFTVLSIVDHYRHRNLLDRSWFFDCMVYVGLFRVVYYFPMVSNSIKLLFLNISIFSQCLLVVVSLIAFMAFVGLNLFKNRLKYCFVLNASWFYSKIGLTDIYNSESDLNHCVNSPYVSDVFYFNQLQIKVNSFSHFFNFDTVLNAIETVFQIMKGSDLSTIQLITSLKNFDEKQKNASLSYWPYVVLVCVVGILTDAFLFSVIAELVDKALPSEGIFNKIVNKQMRCVYLALENLKHLLPWEDGRYCKKAGPFLRFATRVVSSQWYNRVQMLISVVNLLFITIQWSYDRQLVDAIESLFLINYLLDGVLKVNIVGKDIFRYPSVVLLDLLFPLTLYTLFVSGLRLPKRLLWSTLLFLRFLYPDRYLRFDFQRKGNIIIRVIVNSFSYQLYLLAVLAFLLLCFSRIGQILFRHLDFNLLVFEPNHMPYFYSSFFLSFVHLTSNTFTDDYDQVTATMQVRNEFCRKADPYHRYYLIAEKQIVKAVDYRLNLHELELGKQSEANNTLILCGLTYVISSGFYLNFTYDSDQIEHLMRIIRKSCTKDTLIEQSELLNCDFDLDSYAKKIRYMYSFRNQLNLGLAGLFNSTSEGTDLTFQRLADLRNRISNGTNNITEELITDSDQYYDYLNGFCEELNGRRYSTIRLDDERRFSNYSKIAKVIQLDFLNVFKFIMSNKFAKPLDRICTRPETIKLFYLLFYVVAKVLIMNILKAILFKRYDVEKVRDSNGYFNSDIQQFINGWRSFADLKSDDPDLDPDHLPVHLVLDFVRQKCPDKFRLPEPTVEGCLYILCKYSAKLSCFADRNDFSSLSKLRVRMHLLDVLSICIAVRLNCSPTVFHFSYPSILRHLAIYILRTFPTYELNQAQSIGLEEIVNQHYLTKLFILNQLRSKLAVQRRQTQ